MSPNSRDSRLIPSAHPSNVFLYTGPLLSSALEIVREFSLVIRSRRAALHVREPTTPALGFLGHVLFLLGVEKGDVGFPGEVQEHRQLNVFFLQRRVELLGDDGKLLFRVM